MQITENGMVARQGFEPRQTEPESAVLPLHHRAMDSGSNYAICQPSHVEEHLPCVNSTNPARIRPKNSDHGSFSTNNI